MSETLLQCLSIKQVAAILGVSVTTVWRMRRRGEFPNPVQLSHGCVRFLEKDVAEWIEARRG